MATIIHLNYWIFNGRILVGTMFQDRSWMTRDTTLSHYSKRWVVIPQWWSSRRLLPEEFVPRLMSTIKWSCLATTGQSQPSNSRALEIRLASVGHSLLVLAKEPRMLWRSWLKNVLESSTALWMCLPTSLDLIWTVEIHLSDCLWKLSARLDLYL